jgi:uncharacterized protein
MPRSVVTAPVGPYLLGAVLLAAVVHAYLWRRLVRDTGLSATRARLASAALALCAALFPAGMAGLLFMRVLPRPLASPLLTTAFAYVGALYFLLLALGALEVRRLVRRSASDAARARARRHARFALGTAGLLSVVALWQAQRPLVVHERRIELPGLPPALAGYRIAHLSDLHVGPTLGGAFVADLVRRTREAHPDLVVITGDLVDGTPAELGPLLRPLAELDARDGVYMVFGNHEHLSGAEAWRAYLPGLGVRVLADERVAIGAHLELVGVDDGPGSPAARAEALARAFAGHEKGRLTVALVHEPVEFPAVAAQGARLQLSGHTHGGQIFPLHALEWLDQRYVVGVHRLGAALLHVTPGAGFWGPPMRLGSTSEISLLVLLP